MQQLYMMHSPASSFSMKLWRESHCHSKLSAYVLKRRYFILEVLAIGKEQCSKEVIVSGPCCLELDLLY